MVKSDTRSRAIWGAVSTSWWSCSIIRATFPANTIEYTFCRSRTPPARLLFDGIIWNTLIAAVKLSTSGEVNSMPNMACTNSGLAIGGAHQTCSARVDMLNWTSATCSDFLQLAIWL